MGPLLDLFPPSGCACPGSRTDFPPQGSDFVMSSPAFPVTSYLLSALCVLPLLTLPGGLRATPGPGTPPGGLMRLFTRQILVKLQPCASFVPGTGGAIVSDTGRCPASVESSFHGVGTRAFLVVFSAVTGVRLGGMGSPSGVGA